MFKMFSTFFTMMTQFINGAGKLGNAIEILAGEAEHEAQYFAKANAIERSKKLKALESQA